MLWFADQIKGRLAQPNVAVISTVVSTTTVIKPICPRYQTQIAKHSFCERVPLLRECDCAAAA